MRATGDSHGVWHSVLAVEERHAAVALDGGDDLERVDGTALRVGRPAKLAEEAAGATQLAGLRDVAAEGLHYPRQELQHGPLVAQLGQGDRETQ